MNKSSSKFNYIYSVSYSILAMLLPLITSPYVSRVLGAKNLGIYSYTYSIVNYFILFIMLGISNYGNRQVAKVRDNQEELNKVFSEIYTMQFLSGVAILAFYLFYMIVVVEENKSVFFIQTLMIIGTIMNVNWFFWGLEQFKITVTRNFIIKISSFLCIILFVKSKDDLWIYTLILSLGLAFSDGFLFFLLPKYIQFRKPKLSDVVKHFKPNIILFIPVITVSIYRTMDKIMLKEMVDYSQVGYYTNSEKIINLCLSIVTALGQVMLPKMTNILAQGKNKQFFKLLAKSVKFITVVSCALVFGILAVAEEFVPLFFGNGYEPCISILKFLAPNLILLAWGNVIKTQFLIPKEKDFVYIKSAIFGVVVNGIINYIFIPKYAAIGAAIGTLCAEMISLIYILFKIRKEIKLKGYFLNIPYFGIGLIMYFVVTAVKQALFSGVAALIIEILVGGAVYILLILVYWIIIKDELLLELKNTVKGKLHLK